MTVPPEQDLSGRLSPARFAHVCRVADTSERLARRHGVDPDRARLAGLYHDWAREMPAAELLGWAERLHLPSAVAPAVLHGPVAARLLPDLPGLDATVRQAIDRHTTGAPGMSQLDMVLFVADLIEPGRRFDGVEAIRALAETDLEGATLAALDATLSDLIRRGRPRHPAISRGCPRPKRPPRARKALALAKRRRSGSFVGAPARRRGRSQRLGAPQMVAPLRGAREALRDRT
jgi:predicted HD superfamily hydrolase involved in NAD metabolism